MKADYGEKTLESMNQAIWYNKWTMAKFIPYINGEILEVGCGIGNFTKELTKYGKVWAIDINRKYLNQIKNIPDVEAGLGDIEKGEYFFTKKQFDTIICLNVLEHIQNDNKAIENLNRLLKKDGVLILLIPTHSFLYGEIDKNIGHFRRYGKQEIVNKLKRVGFNVLKTRKLNILGAVGWYVAGKIFKRDIIENNNIKIFNLLAPLILPFEDIIEPPVGTSLLIVAKRT